MGTHTMKGEDEVTIPMNAQWETMPMDDDKGGSPKRRSTTKYLVITAVLGLLWIIMSVRTVPPANVAIAVPLCSLVHFNLKTQLLYSENIVPTQEGLNVELDVALLYHVDTEKIRAVFLSLGVDYEKILILPELQSAVRGLTSEVSAKALYTSGRTEIRNKLMDDMKEKLTPRGIVLEDVLLKGIKLPKQLTDSIELKAKAEQESARME